MYKGNPSEERLSQAASRPDELQCSQNIGIK